MTCCQGLSSHKYRGFGPGILSILPLIKDEILRDSLRMKDEYEIYYNNERDIIYDSRYNDLLLMFKDNDKIHIDDINEIVKEIKKEREEKIKLKMNNKNKNKKEKEKEKEKINEEMNNVRDNKSKEKEQMEEEVEEKEESNEKEKDDEKEKRKLSDDDNNENEISSEDEKIFIIVYSYK